MQFSGQKNQADKVKALLNFDSKISVITPVYIAKLGLTTQKITVGAQKIDGLVQETYSIVLARFLLQDSLERVWFFEETSMLIDTSLKVVSKIPFFSFSKAVVEFAKLKKLTWNIYNATEVLSITNWVELIDGRKFAKAALDKNSKTFVMHVAALIANESNGIKVHPLWVPQLATL